jgi:quinol monooxygenase YgiN
MAYGYFGSMRTLPGRRDEVVALLADGADGLRAVGCHFYVVGVDDADDVTIWVSEVWRSREDHHASLQLPAVREAIAKARPLLTGDFTSQAYTVVGGLGVPKPD